VEREIVLDPEIKNLNWLAGFVDGEGSFYVRLKDATENVRSKNRVSFFFWLTQSVRDEKLMTLIAESLGCGIISSNDKYISLKVAKFEDIRTKIIPCLFFFFFSKKKKKKKYLKNILISD